MVSKINNALISAGYTKEAADVAGTPLSWDIASVLYGKAALPGAPTWGLQGFCLCNWCIIRFCHDAAIKASLLLCRCDGETSHLRLFQWPQGSRRQSAAQRLGQGCIPRQQLRPGERPWHWRHGHRQREECACALTLQPLVHCHCHSRSVVCCQCFFQCSEPSSANISAAQESAHSLGDMGINCRKSVHVLY